jgi:hypothetical protein
MRRSIRPKQATLRRSVKVVVSRRTVVAQVSARWQAADLRGWGSFGPVAARSVYRDLVARHDHLVSSSRPLKT